MLETPAQRIEREAAERELAEERAKYAVTIEVTDTEMELTDLDDIGGFRVLENGMLVVFDLQDRTIAGWAPGCWFNFAVSRVDRVESTDRDNDTKDTD